MLEVSTIGLDIAKQVFQAHGADGAGHAVFRKKLTRTKLIEFFRSQRPCVVALEACGGAHYWGREIAQLGHTVRFIPPAYVKPFVKRQKNDAADAEAIYEAAQRPSMLRVQHVAQAATSWPGATETDHQAGTRLTETIERIRWRLWHGQVKRALDLIAETIVIVDPASDDVSTTATAARKVACLLGDLETYVSGHSNIIIEGCTRSEF